MSFDVNASDLAAMLAVLGCTVAAAMIAGRLVFAVRKRERAAVFDLLGCGLVLVLLASVFFHHQRQRPVEYVPGASLVEQAAPAEPTPIEHLRRDAQRLREESQQRRDAEDAEQRQRERRERDELLKSLTRDAIQ